MAITIREVAEEAGVSITAVSKVLHGRGKSVRVSDQKAELIREVATRLKYRPNALARNLRSSRTHTVGLIFENFWNISGGPLYYLHLLDGVASPLFNNHYRLTILPELAPDDVLGTLGDGQLEGVVWCKLARDPQTARLIAECPIPIVAMNTPPPDVPSGAVYVSCDNESGITLAVDHLWDLGHRRILFLSEIDEHDTPDCVSRREAFERCIGAKTGEDPANFVASWHWDFPEFAQWWANGPTHTAIVCWTERGAAQVLDRARECGVSVPDELSVIGFDSTQFCETTSPRLTAVCQPIFEMAKCASETLLKMIQGECPERDSIIYPCTLDVRDSTARPASSRLDTQC